MSSAAATDRVVLEGLDIEGLGTGLNGVSVLAGKEIYIIRCAIRHFTQNGVNMASSTSGGRVIIKDSFILFNAGGVNVQGSGGAANSAIIDSSLLDGNTSFAVQANGAGQAISLAHSNLLGSPTGISALGGAAVASRGPSNVITGAGSPTLTPAFQ